MAYQAASVGDARLISALVRRLGRLVTLQRALQQAGPRAEHRLDLVHAAIRSTLVDLARLGQADLAATILSRGRPGRLRRTMRRRHRPTTISTVLDEPARR